MAEEEGPEQSPGPGTQPGPGQEHYDKFTIGEEEARQFPQPEFRSDLPEGPGKKHFKKFTIGDSEKDIQGLQPEWNPNLVDLKGALVADQGGEDEEAYDRYRAYGRAVATTMSRFSDPLQNIEEAKTKLGEAEKDQKEAEDKGDQKG
ncbi:hypothetical protein IID21_02450, partial [Patescibacteria group bacterium]|nr:hypothetical protein [Patescibacteria group bacterium]